MGWHLDGKARSLSVRIRMCKRMMIAILPQGTAYLTDVGMVGLEEGVLGMERNAVLHKFLTQLPARFVVDEGKWHFHAVSIEIDDADGQSRSNSKNSV